MCSQHGWNFVCFCLSQYNQKISAKLNTFEQTIFWCCEQNRTQFFGVVNTDEQNLSALWRTIWKNLDVVNKIPQNLGEQNWTTFPGVVDTVEQNLGLTLSAISNTRVAIHYTLWPTACSTLSWFVFRPTWKSGLRNTMVRLIQ